MLIFFSKKIKTTASMLETQETQVRSLDQVYPLEKGMATRSTILAWRIPGQRSLVGYNPQDHKELDMTEVTEGMHAHTT